MEIAMKILATATLLIQLMVSYVHATEQASDWIIYRGRKLALIDIFPMESYFNKHPNKEPKSNIESSSLWRGYQATYEFQENTLVLKDIEIETLIVVDSNKPNTAFFSRKSVKNQVVQKGETLKIDWISGILVLGYEGSVSGSYEGERTYDDYILLSVKNGNLTGKREFDSKGYEKFKDRQFQAFKKTEEYKEAVSEFRKANVEASQGEIDLFIREFFMRYSSEFLDEKLSPNNSDEKNYLQLPHDRKD
jgi:hypothetical protein